MRKIRILSEKYCHVLVKRKIIENYKSDFDNLLSKFIMEETVSEMDVINMVSQLNIKLSQCFDEFNTNNISLEECLGVRLEDNWDECKANKHYEFKYEFNHVLDCYVIIYPNCYEKLFIKGE